MKLLTMPSPPLPRSASDEAQARMEAGAGAGDAPLEEGTEAEAELEALDGLLEALRARGEVQAAQAQALVEGWGREVGERRALCAALAEAAGEAAEGPQQQQQRQQQQQQLAAAVVPSGAGKGPGDGEDEEEEASEVWVLLAERLRELGIHRLAAALKEGASRPGSSLSLASSSAYATPCPSRPGSAASLLGGEVGSCWGFCACACGLGWMPRTR